MQALWSMTWATWAAFDPSPVDAEALRRDPAAVCLDLATRITQSLIARIFALPSEASAVGRLAKLPPPSTPLPRAKPLPKVRATCAGQLASDVSGPVSPELLNKRWGAVHCSRGSRRGGRSSLSRRGYRRRSAASRCSMRPQANGGDDSATSAQATMPTSRSWRPSQGTRWALCTSADVVMWRFQMLSLHASPLMPC